MSIFTRFLAMFKSKPDPAPKDGESFADWFHRQGFRNFNAEELSRLHRRVKHGAKNTHPPRSKWGNIIPTLRIVDDLRDVIGPILITSAYRSKAYNDACGSNDASQHRQFTALDIIPLEATVHEAYKVLEAWRDNGKWVGGLGKYPNFVHIDTRPRNATW